MKPMIVAVDGPAGSGKSSVCKGTARVLHWRYLDTGAMWAVLQAGIDPQDASLVADFCTTPVITSGYDPANPSITVDGVDVGLAIRDHQVTTAVSAVSAVPKVREVLVQLQRRHAAEALQSETGIVVEGRDITTVVLPNADVKIFLTARPEVRALRRAKEESGASGASDQDVQATQEALERRDHLDSTRIASPLTQSADAIELDTSDLSLEEVIAEVVSRVEAGV
jgi:cytidylate kinase